MKDYIFRSCLHTSSKVSLDGFKRTLALYTVSSKTNAWDMMRIWRCHWPLLFNEIQANDESHEFRDLAETTTKCTKDTRHIKRNFPSFLAEQFHQQEMCSMRMCTFRRSINSMLCRQPEFCCCLALRLFTRKHFEQWQNMKNRSI